MIKLTLTFLILFALVNNRIQAQTSITHEKLRRADCFFGVHFDLHASEDITDAGRTLTPEMIDTFLTKVRPDFIQIDCKGHPGISSYPTKVGYHVKGFQKDPLKLWREVTEKNKVALFMHYSGVMDAKAVKEHPDWALLKANGELSKEKISFFSPYLDQLLIPQLKELSGDYHVDGAWIDGDCWAVEPDYSAEAIKAWTQKTGISEIPRNRTDHYYPEYLEYTRSLFQNYMKKYIDAIHAYDPKFQITSNWSYSSLMPEKVENNVDFLSGDVTPQNGVFRSAFEARCMAPQGKPWDLMAWGFSWNGDKMPMSNKSVIQLEQEAAEIIAMGGGVQFYFQQNRDLSLKPWLATTLSELGTFCRERQAYCHKAKAIPQVALLFPTLSYQHNSKSVFSGSPEKLQATLYALLDNQYPVEVLMEHNLSGKTGQYPLIVIPECDSIAPPMLNELRTYVQNGGNLLVIGAETVGIFAKELGIQSSNTIEEKTTFISAANRLGSILSPIRSVELTSDSKVISNFYDVCDYRYKSKTIASSVRQVGKGKIAAIYFNAGTAYSKYKTPVIRDFIAETMAQLSPEKMVEVTGSHLVHVALNKLNGKTYINLINVAGESTNQSAIGYDQVPALTDLTVSIKTPAKPSRIVMQPENKNLDFTYINGKSTILISKLKIHSILEITE
ncbi:MAG: hypothetical protein Q8N05_19140 [Bacteroidota bacterium]|nr:hypothetical protein [Bacteroidota bacterium]